MKTKTKRDFKQAERFIGQLQGQLASSFSEIANLLTAYESRSVDRDAVFSAIVAQIKHHPQLLQQFNAFLNPEKRVAIIPPSKIHEMLSFLLEELNKKYSADPDRFHSFIDFFYIISKERSDRIYFTSYPEMVSHTLKEIRSSAEIQQLGHGFIADIEDIMQRYLEGVLSRPLVYVEPPPEEAVAPLSLSEEALEPPAPKPQPVSTTAPKRSGKQRAAAPKEREPEKQAPVPRAPSPPKPAEPAPEEPAVENLRIDENVFKALRQKLSGQDYQLIAKNLYLYVKNVVSYFEFVKLSEKVLLKAEKEICLALKEIVEGRERSRTANNVFNIKLHLQEQKGPDNHSYKRIITPELNSGAGEHALINKTFMATARGNESAVNFDEGLHKKAYENVAEKILFKSEDEIHEFDSILHQTKVALVWIRALKANEISEEKASALCKKLSNVRVLNYLYGSKGPQIIEELKSRPPELIEMVENRVQEKIEVLQTARLEFSEKNWQALQQVNYYKALDARLNSIKFAEKRFFNNRGFLNKIKENELCGKVLRGNSMEGILNGKKTKNEFVDIWNKNYLFFWNPVISFIIKDEEIISDISFFVKAFLKPSKMSSNEKEKASAFFEKTFSNFFRVTTEKQKSVLSPLPNREELLERIFAFEHNLYPSKSFYFSEKLTLKLEENNYTQANGYLLHLAEASKEGIRGSQDEVSPLAQNTPSEPNKALKSDSIDKNAAENNASKEKPAEGKRAERPGEMLIECPEASRADYAFFYAPQQFFFVYQHYFFLYERFSWAKEFSLSKFGDLSFYDFFKQTLFMHLFGILDASQYEDAIRMLFDQMSGLFLHFDKLLGHCVKNLPNDELSAFALNLNSQVFSSDPQALNVSEQVVLAKTYAKMLELAAVSSKTSKGNPSAGQLAASSAIELMKFDFDFSAGQFLVHKVNVAPEFEAKVSLAGQNNFIEELYSKLTRPTEQRILITKGHSRTKKWISNNMAYFLKQKKQELSFSKSGGEDLIFSFHRETVSDARKKKIMKLRKLKRFREERLGRLEQLI